MADGRRSPVPACDVRAGVLGLACHFLCREGRGLVLIRDWCHSSRLITQRGLPPLTPDVWTARAKPWPSNSRVDPT